MIKLNLPDVELQTRVKGTHIEVYDSLRRKFVILTEEEWVRQHLIQYLAIQKMVPVTMMASERGLMVNKLPKRFDLLIFGKDGKPIMIVECKAPQIPLNEEVFYQAARYNLTLQVKYLLISNGLEHHCLYVDYTTGETRFLEDIPIYNNL